MCSTRGIARSMGVENMKSDIFFLHKNSESSIGFARFVDKQYQVAEKGNESIHEVEVSWLFCVKGIWAEGPWTISDLNYGNTRSCLVQDSISSVLSARYYDPSTIRVVEFPSSSLPPPLSRSISLSLARSSWDNLLLATRHSPNGKLHFSHLLPRQNPLDTLPQFHNSLFFQNSWKSWENYSRFPLFSQEEIMRIFK